MRMAASWRGSRRVDAAGSAFMQPGATLALPLRSASMALRSDGAARHLLALHHHGALAEAGLLAGQRQELGPGELGHALSLSSPAASALLARLEAQGRITHVAAATDHRRVVIVPDPAMLDTLVDYFQPLGQSVAAALVGCTESDLAVIVGFLEHLVDATNGLTSGEPVTPQDASASSAPRVIAAPGMD